MRLLVAIRLAVLVPVGVAGVELSESGCLTLELVNEGETPIALYPGVRIAQIALHWLDAETDHPDALSGGRYFGATAPLAAKLEKESDEIARLQRLGGALRVTP